jgi:arylsulfatase A-like enzyme
VLPGVNNALVSQVDFLASLAHLTGFDVETTDSQDLLDVFLGKSDTGRENLVLEAMGRTAFRQGDWLLIPPYEGPAIQPNVQIELGNYPNYQLYNLVEDLGQTQNLADTQPEKLKEMQAAYAKIMSSE